MYKIARLEREVVNKYGNIDENQLDQVMEDELEDMEIEGNIDREERNFRGLSSNYWDGDTYGEEEEDVNYDDY